MSGVAWDETNEGRDIFPPIVLIDRISVMDRIEKAFLNPEFREVCFHGEKRVKKRKYTMPGSSRNCTPDGSPSPIYNPAENNSILQW